MSKVWATGALKSHPSKDEGWGTRRWSSFRAYFLVEAGRVRVNEWEVC
jgi:hypothetical protein